MGRLFGTPYCVARVHREPERPTRSSTSRLCRTSVLHYFQTSESISVGIASKLVGKTFKFNGSEYSHPYFSSLPLTGSPASGASEIKLKLSNAPPNCESLPMKWLETFFTLFTDDNTQSVPPNDYRVRGFDK